MDSTHRGHVIQGIVSSLLVSEEIRLLKKKSITGEPVICDTVMLMWRHCNAVKEDRVITIDSDAYHVTPNVQWLQTHTYNMVMTMLLRKKWVDYVVIYTISCNQAVATVTIHNDRIPAAFNRCAVAWISGLNSSAYQTRGTNIALQHPLSVNSFWPSDAIWRYRSGSILAQVIDCCLTTPSQYLNLTSHQWYFVAFTREQCHKT